MASYVCTFALIATMSFTNHYNKCDIPRYIELHYDISAEDMQLVYRVVMSEAGGDGVLSQKGVTTVLLNRLFSPIYPDNIPELIEGQFSTADNGEPTEEVIRSVNSAILDYGTRRQILPYQCYYFRACDYHSFGIPYCQLGNNYFSLGEEATD